MASFIKDRINPTSMLGLMLVSPFLEYYSNISNEDIMSINTNRVQLFEDIYVFFFILVGRRVFSHTMSTQNTQLWACPARVGEQMACCSQCEPSVILDQSFFFSLLALLKQGMLFAAVLCKNLRNSGHQCLGVN